MVQIRRMRLADAPAAATIADEAFHNNKVFCWLFPYYDQYPNELRRWFLLRLKQRCVEPGVYVFVAEEGDEILGYAVWKRLGQDSEAAKWQQDSLVSVFSDVGRCSMMNGKR
jgi:hypothetical protein